MRDLHVALQGLMAFPGPSGPLVHLVTTAERASKASRETQGIQERQVSQE